MTIEVSPAAVDEVHSLRELYRHEMACQIIMDSFAERGFSDAFLVRSGCRTAGYGLVAKRHFPGALHEFYLLPGYRSAAQPICRRLLEESGATAVRAQTNDPLLLLMLYDFAREIDSETVLFADAFATQLTCSTGTFRAVTAADRERLFEHKREPEGEWMIESGGVPVATGGVLYHYNPPYGDLYMEVHAAHRRRGFGSFLIQELKRMCYESGHIPAARCNTSNTASRATLQRAGMLPCGRVLAGALR